MVLQKSIITIACFACMHVCILFFAHSNTKRGDTQTIVDEKRRQWKNEIREGMPNICERDLIVHISMASYLVPKKLEQKKHSIPQNRLSVVC